jgi:hypothetical protein
VSLGAMTIEIRTFCTVDLIVTLRHYAECSYDERRQAEYHVVYIFYLYVGFCPTNLYTKINHAHFGHVNVAYGKFYFSHYFFSEFVST